jgi:hypothetical protein
VHLKGLGVSSPLSAQPDPLSAPWRAVKLYSILAVLRVANLCRSKMMGSLAPDRWRERPIILRYGLPVLSVAGRA